MALQYRIKNWAKFQHYKDRNPPWIKLHVEILASEDWVMLDDASKLVMVVCMIVAAKFDGIVSDDPAYFRRVAYLCKTPNLKPLIECGFLQPIAADSERKQMLADARPEKEAEQSRAEKESISLTPVRSSSSPPGDFDQFWMQCPRKIGKGAAKKAHSKAILKTAPATILAGIVRYASSRAGQPEEYTKHPATWLNAECWLDETGTGPPSLRVVLSDDVAAQEQENLKRMGIG